jgi:hypothetical protein
MEAGANASIGPIGAAMAKLVSLDVLSQPNDPDA